MAPTVSFSWDFSQGSQNWLGGFADYPAGEEDFYNLDFGVRSLPTNLGNESALFITGDNRSDDLFMYFRNEVSGLEPNQTYSVIFDIQLASNAPDGSVGIGGSPANSVYLKAGATLEEPVPINNNGFLELNIDKGFQANNGPDSVILGDIAKPDDGNFDYALIERDNQQNSFTFTTDSDGDAWLYFGTDSGFEGTTALYYTSFSAEFAPVAAIPEPPSYPMSIAGGLLLLGLWVYRKQKTATRK